MAPQCHNFGRGEHLHVGRLVAVVAALAVVDELPPVQPVYALWESSHDPRRRPGQVASHKRRCAHRSDACNRRIRRRMPVKSH